MTTDRPKIAELPYPADSAVLFETLAHLPWAVFLDSGYPAIRQGRYDILAAEPWLTLTTRGEITEIRGADGVELSGEDPFLLLRRYLGEPAEGVAGLPFGGGAIGYFAYDLGRRIERLPALARDDIQLPEMAVGLYDWAVVVDHVERCCWLVGQGRDGRTFERWEALLKRLTDPEPQQRVRQPFRVLSKVRSNMDRAYYARAFDRIEHYIREGDCYQVNFAQRFSARAEGDPWLAYRRLRVMNPAPFAAYVATPYGTILSASPERFLRVRDGRVETKPIKGTRPRSSDPARDRALAEELLRSPKDRAENLMIVDLLRNDLGKNCAIGSVKVPKLFALESFATVHHLVSTIAGELAPDRHALDLLRGCFPGGSITGAPKLRAMEIIEELEPHRRGVYCGSIGYIGFDGAMDTNVAIRTLLHAGKAVHFYAGGGIVADSRMEEEYQETFDKAAALLRLLEQGEMRQCG